MKNVKRMIIITLLVTIIISMLPISVNAAKVIEKDGIKITKISNPDRGEREVDGLISGGDRENSYTWRLAERGDYIYIATTRNIASAIINMYGEAFLTSGISKDVLWGIVDVVTNGNVPRNDENNGANIISYNKKSGEFKVIYTAEKYTYFRMAVTFGDDVYFGSYSANPDVEQYILKLDKEEKFTKVFTTKGSVSLRANCVYDDHLYFAGADEREFVKENDGNPTKIAVIQKSNEDDKVWNRVADYKDFGEYAYDSIMSSWAGAPVWELSSYKGYIYATLPSTAGFVMFKGHPASGSEKANEYGWYWKEVVGLNNGINEPGLSSKKGGNPGTMRSLIGSTFVFKDELYVYNFDHGFGGELLGFAGLMSQISGSDVKASEYLKHMYDSLQNPQSLWKLNDKTGKFEECKGFTELVKGTTNEYVWRAGEYDGQMYLATFDAATLYNYFTCLTNDSFSKMTDEEIEEQIGYINNLIKLIVNEYNLDEKINLGEFEEKLKDVKDMLSKIDTMEINKDNIKKFLDKYSDISENLQTVVKELKSKIDDQGAEQVLREYIEKYGVYDLLNKYITEENLSELVNLILNEEQKKEAMNQIKLYLGLDENAEISEEEMISFATIYVKYEINDVLEKAIVKIADAYNKIDWEGLEMYNYISNMVKNDKWGFDLIRTADGVNFELITDDGFGDKYNYGVPSFLATDEGLYIGTCNPFYGAQLYLLTTGNEEKKVNEYEIIEGANQIFNSEDDKNLAFKCNMDYELFEKMGKVYVDEKEVDEKYYTSKSGSTIITFTDEYVDLLSEGEHTLKIALNEGSEGEASTMFTISKKNNEEKPTNIEEEENKTQGESSKEVEKIEEKNDSKKSNNPRTGDNIGKWINLMAFSMLGIAVTVIYTRKSKNNR